MHRYVCAFALAATLGSYRLIAEQSASAGDLNDRITQAADSSSLLSTDLQPWHLKLDATFYDAAGKNPYTGTIEAWHSGDDSRTVIIVGSASRTVIHTAGKSFVSQSGTDVPALADDLLDNVLSPGPSPADIKDATLDLRVESFGKLKLDCIMLDQHGPHTSAAPLGLFPTYCLNPGDTTLRATYNFGSVSVLRNRIGKFQGKNVALDVTLMEGPVVRAEAKISALATFTPSDEFKPGQDLKPIGTGQTRISGAVMMGYVVSKIPPVYPISARQNHITGTVVLHAIIGRDGHVQYLRPVSAPDPDLAIAAIAAVRQWTYSPFLLNGEPVEVDTTITVNFNMNFPL